MRAGLETGASGFSTLRVDLDAVLAVLPRRTSMHAGIAVGGRGGLWSGGGRACVGHEGGCGAAEGKKGRGGGERRET